MKSFGARWNNALAVVLTFVLIFSFAPYISAATVPDVFGLTGDLALPAKPPISSPATQALLKSIGASYASDKICLNYPAYPGEYRPCWDITFGFPTYGMCVAPTVCLGLGTVGITGAAIGIGKGIVDSIFGGDSSGMRSGASVSGTPLTGTAQCSRYYQVTVQTSDPCAIYVPPTTSSLLNNSSQLLNALRAPSVSDALLVQSNKVSAPPPPQNQTGLLPSGAKGNISLTSTSATIQAGVRNVEFNVESAGFFGANVPQNTNPQGFLERMCLVRQWQSPIISYGIPTSLFDNLCSSKSLRVGILPEISAPPAQTAAKPAQKPTVATSTEPTKPAGPYVVPRAVIRATPASVSLGSRSTISWASQGVDSCTETSPDGSFNSNSLRGEASTVPISSATTFVISCIAPDGSHVTDSVTVNLAI